MTTPFNLASFADKVSSTGTANPSAISDIANTSTGALAFPVGTTAQRNGTPVNGMTRINSTTSVLEVYYNGSWVTISNLPSPTVVGQQAYTTAGTYTWVAPTGVTSVSVVCVGGGGRSSSTNGGGGGSLSYKNNITVVPGNSYTVVVGAGGLNAPNVNGEASSFNSISCVAGGGTAGDSNGAGGVKGAGDGGGNGGPGGSAVYSYGSGGGAGGYSGVGGSGSGSGAPNFASGGIQGTAGSGGGGGGGSSGQNTYTDGGGGGGVGILGEGANGAARGGGGSGGASGTSTSGTGALYGGGGGAFTGTVNGGANGAVRIIWPGDTRLFPATNTGDM